MTDPSPTFYHYTTWQGALGIIEQGHLWATHAAFLNDSQELLFGRNKLVSELKGWADALVPIEATAKVDVMTNDDFNRATFARSAVRTLGEGCGADQDCRYSTYVACFCEEPDLLSQWRGYGPPGGCALGLDLSQLASRNQPVSLSLVQVAYGDQAVTAMIERIKAELPLTAMMFPGMKGDWFASRRIIPALASVKHSSFAEEKERRLVGMADEEDAELAVEFRTSSLGITPYIMIPLIDTSLCEVMIGPGPHQKIRAEGVGRLLKRKGLHHVSVGLSATPFRG